MQDAGYAIFIHVGNSVRYIATRLCCASEHSCGAFYFSPLLFYHRRTSAVPFQRHRFLSTRIGYTDRVFQPSYGNLVPFAEGDSRSRSPSLYVKRELHPIESFYYSPIHPFYNIYIYTPFVLEFSKKSKSRFSHHPRCKEIIIFHHIFFPFLYLGSNNNNKLDRRPR